MPRKTKKKLTTDRVVYEVTTPQRGTHQVAASTTKELKAALLPLLGLEPYSTQAAAHLAHTEQATVQGANWSIKRVGVLAFVPDDASKPKAKKKNVTPDAKKPSESAQPQPPEPSAEGQAATATAPQIAPQMSKKVDEPHSPASSFAE